MKESNFRKKRRLYGGQNGDLPGMFKVTGGMCVSVSGSTEQDALSFL